MKRWVIIAGVVVTEIAMAVALLPWANRATLNTTDFVNFYAAATIVRQGNAARLYEVQTQGPVLAALLGHPSREYFLHPPVFAAALAPLSYLSIDRAFLIWTLFNMALLGLLPMLFSECADFVKRRPQLGLLGTLFAPVMVALTLGQDSILLLFLFGVGYVLVKRGRDPAAGFVLAAATTKFQYVLVVVLFLIFQRRWKLVAGFALGCAILLAVTFFLFGGQGILEYVNFVHNYDVSDGFGTLHTDLMVNARGFFAGLGWRHNTRTYTLAISAVLIVLGALCSRFNSERNTSLTFALYVTLALLASPYAFFQDSTLLLLPLYLALDFALLDSGSLRNLLIFSCTLLFVGPLLLLAIGGHYWWNSRIYLMFPVILLFALTLAAQIYWTRPESVAEFSEDFGIAVS